MGLSGLSGLSGLGGVVQSGGPPYAERLLGIQPANLVGYWPLAEGASDAVAADLSGNTNHGVYIGTPTLGAPGIGDGRTSLYVAGNGAVQLFLANMAKYPDFETLAGANDFSLWVESAGTGSVTDEAVIVHSGSHAARLTAGATANTFLSQALQVVPGTEYTLSFWTRGDGTNGGRYTVIKGDYSGYIVANNTPTVVTGADYTEVTRTFTVPAGVTSIVVRFICPAALGGIAYYDDVSVLPVGKPRFSGVAGTWSCWARVSGAGDWTDGTSRYLCRAKVDGANAMTFWKSSINNQVGWQGYAGGLTYDAGQDTGGTLDWFHLGLTWSQADGVAIGYYNGVAEGAGGAIGVWAGEPMGTHQVVGAESTESFAVSAWRGWIAHPALWDSPLTPAEMAALAVR